MANKTSNFPQAQAGRVQPEVISDLIEWFNHLRVNEKPKSNQELKDRIDWYFAECQEQGRRPTVETMCLALGMSRQAAWKARQKHDSRSEILDSAWQVLAATAESFLTEGTVNPVSGIFLLKSQFGYRDTITVESSSDTDGLMAALPSKEDILKRLPKRMEIDDDPEIDL